MCGWCLLFAEVMVIMRYGVSSGSECVVVGCLFQLQSSTAGIIFEFSGF